MIGGNAGDGHRLPTVLEKISHHLLVYALDRLYLL